MFLRLAVVSAVQLLQDAPEVLASEMGGSAIAAAGDCIGGLCVAPARTVQLYPHPTLFPVRCMLCTSIYGGSYWEGQWGIYWHPSW